MIAGELTDSVRRDVPGKVQRGDVAAMTDVVAALIWRGGRFLVCQRPAHKRRGLLWEFAGGKVEPGETPEAALIRECREELGLTVAVEDVYMTLTHHYPDFSIRLTLMQARIVAGEPQRLEHAAFGWVTPEEAAALPFCPADEVILARLRRESHTGE